MAFEQTGDSISVLVKGAATIKAGTALFVASDGTYTPGAAANDLSKLASGMVAGILLQDVAPTGTSVAGAKAGSIAVPNGCFRKALAASGYTPAIGDLVSFDASGFAILYASGAGKRCYGVAMNVGVASHEFTLQFIAFPPVTFTA
jgi:hypothetical protein